MIHAQREKHGVVFAPQSDTDGATASGNIDTRGFDYCAVDVVVDSHSSASHNPDTCKLSESDDTVVSNFADITAFVGDTAWTIPDADTANPQMYRLNVDLRKQRKRYIKVSLTVNTTQLIACNYHLSRATEMPLTTTEAGVAALING